MALGRPLGAKLFLEGKEVPFIGATITSAVNQASIAYIDIVPHKSINDIKPRTLVHLFVRDYQDPGPMCVFPYVLAWQGEVFGYNFGKTPASRTFSLSCIDMSSYWDNCLSYFFNAQQSLGGGNLEMARQALNIKDIKETGERIINVVMSQSSYYKTKIEAVLNETKNLPDGDPNKKDFLDAFIAIYNDLSNVNDFFMLAEDRLRIKDQIIMHSSKALAKLVSDDVARNWFTDLPGKTSGYSTLRSVIQDLMGVIFHDFVSIPFPGETKSGVTFTTPKAGLNPTNNTTTKTIGTFLFKPNLYMLPPPACNIFFPDEYSSFQFNRNFLKEPTRLIYMPELPARFQGGGPAVFLPHLFEPPSFDHFMLKPKGDFSKFQDGSATGIPKGINPGHYGDDDTSPSKAINSGLKREGQFLTSEEYMKGILLARENMVPASSAFRSALDDFSKNKTELMQKVAKYLFFKKRFQDRQLQITSHLKMSVVPGFPVLILDDSDADQNITAYCSSVTHRIYATEGGYTNVQLTYARSITEQDVSSNYGSQMLIPPWFEESIFGSVTFPPESKSAPLEVAKLGITHVSTTKLSDFYETLLGRKGSKALTNLYKSEVTMVGAVRQLIADYKLAKTRGTRDVQAFINTYTARYYVKMEHCFKFLMASTKTKDMENTSWIEFTGDMFTRKGKQDSEAVTLRNKVIKTYRDILKTQRGFRG